MIGFKLTSADAATIHSYSLTVFLSAYSISTTEYVIEMPESLKLTAI